MKNPITQIPFIQSIIKFIYMIFIAPFKTFPGSGDYWKERYTKGGTSGAGSYDKSARFKAEVINSFVKEMQVKSIIEFGCGDGNQLQFANYPTYLGFDISPEAILQCQELFMEDETKSFKLVEEYNGEKAELTLSLDVIYHLVEDTVFDKYMNQLFNTATKYVLIYSSDTDKQERLQPAHVKHRKFSKWIEINKPGWVLEKHIPNKFSYPLDKNDGSVADIFIYKLQK
jgi:hypothetical protein